LAGELQDRLGMLGAYRHILIPGRATVRFMHCACAADNPGAGGHEPWLCRDCVDEGREDEAWL
jgi:hypothetical protein